MIQHINAMRMMWYNVVHEIVVVYTSWALYIRFQMLFTHAVSASILSIFNYLRRISCV